MKITPKPVNFMEDMDKSRNVLGIGAWARSVRFIQVIMFLLGWFTIPVEVLLRRNFGQRYFTVINFFGGLIVLGFFATVQAIATWLLGSFSLKEKIMSYFFPSDPQPEPTFTDHILDKSMTIFLIAFIVLSSYHFFRIWWRNRTDTALHSYDDGTSRLEPIALYAMVLVNAGATPLLKLYRQLLPKAERDVTLPAPDLVNDLTSFTNTVFEPFFLFALGYFLHGITSTWLFISCGALLVYANWKETAKLNKVLDFRDSMIDAKNMMELREQPEHHASARNTIIQQAAAKIRDNPQVAPQMAQQYPDLMNIIDEMNRDKGHLGNVP